MYVFQVALSLVIISPIAGLSVAPTTVLPPWSNTWYPFAAVADTDPNSVHSRTILNKDFVFWKSKEGWTAADDVCPHRAAPMNLGYVDKNGHIVCRYHGRAFNKDGECTALPGLVSWDNLDEKRSKLINYPVVETDGVLWLWPFVDQVPLKSPQNSNNTVQTIFMVEQTDYEYMMENTFDPVHAQFLHEGFQFKPHEYVPLSDYSRIEPITSDGFTLTHGGYNIKNKDMKATRRFIAPFTNNAIYDYGKKVSNVVLHFVPVKPGTTAVTAIFLSPKPKSSKGIFKHLSSLSQKVIPTYLKNGLFHGLVRILMNTNNEDATMLHPIRRNMKILQQQSHNTNATWRELYYMPTRDDFGVINFRQWYDTFSNGKIPWLVKPDSDESVRPRDDDQHDDMLLSQWLRHTKYCSSCQKTLLLLNKVKRVSNLASKLFAIWSVYILYQGINLNALGWKKNAFMKMIFAFIAHQFTSVLDSFQNVYFSGTHPFKTLSSRSWMKKKITTAAAVKQ